MGAQYRTCPFAAYVVTFLAVESAPECICPHFLNASYVPAHICPSLQAIIFQLLKMLNLYNDAYQCSSYLEAAIFNARYKGGRISRFRDK